MLATLVSNIRLVTLLALPNIRNYRICTVIDRTKTIMVICKKKYKYKKIRKNGEILEAIYYIQITAYTYNFPYLLLMMQGCQYRQFFKNPGFKSYVQ